jgi:pyrroloquinoline quinone (PQQ) biosynthesis protein C
MTTLYNNFIFSQLAIYQEKFNIHPLFQEAKYGKLSASILKEFALYQYSDSILWVPMLSLMKSKVRRSDRFRRAIEDNIRCETGIGNVSHITLARDLMRSLGVEALSHDHLCFLQESINFWLSDDFARFTEPMVVGWLLVAETLVPQMFSKMLPCFEELGCDVIYFKEHISVDVDEHSQWMSESVQDVLSLYGPESASEILQGMEEAWEETVEIPERLYQKWTGVTLSDEETLSSASEFIDL